MKKTGTAHHSSFDCSVAKAHQLRFLVATSRIAVVAAAVAVAVAAFPAAAAAAPIPAAVQTPDSAP